MAIIELQMRRDAFISFVMNEINRQRLPSPGIDLFPQIKGKLLQRIECTGATVEASAGAARVIVQADLVFHHNTLAAVRAAGSLQAPVTERFEVTLPVTIAVAFDSNGVPSVQWSILNGAFPGKSIPLELGDEIPVRSGAVVADDTVVAIRLGTRVDDPVTESIVDRLGSGDWAQLVGGQVIADVFTQHFADAIAGAVDDKLTLDTPAAGAWFPAFGGSGRMVGVSATVVAVDECLFDIDVPVDLQLVGTFQPSGASMVTTLTLSWEPDSTVCEIVGGLLFTPIASVAINGIANDKASERLLGTAQPFEGFREVARTDESITYQRTTVTDTPSPRFVLQRTEITDEGILTGGALSLQSANRSLEAEVTTPSSALKRDCHRRTVTVEFRHATASLRDLGVEGGPPRLLDKGVTFDPPDCWWIVPGASNTWLDLTLAFVDPPSGRLPAGTATSVFLHTDCGLRWLDLGVIPAQRPAPSTGDIVEMLSHCMAISDRWGMGILNLHWLVDPPDVLHGIDPLRQWTVAARGLPVGTHVEFVAVDRGGGERRLGAFEASADFAVDLLTGPTETLLIKTPPDLEAPAPTVWQRWIVPFASTPLEGERVSLVAVGRLIGVRHAGGPTALVEMRPDGRLHATRVEQGTPRNARVTRLLDALARSERRERCRCPRGPHRSRNRRGGASRRAARRPGAPTDAHVGRFALLPPRPTIGRSTRRGRPRESTGPAIRRTSLAGRLV